MSRFTRAAGGTVRRRETHEDVENDVNEDAAAKKRKIWTEVVSHQETKVEAINSKLEWRIDQFEKLMKLNRNGSNIISQVFWCPEAPDCRWELHIYPNGKRDEDAGHVSFFLRQVGLENTQEPILTEFQIYCIDRNNERVSICRDTKDFTHQQGRGKFQVARDKMMSAVRDNKEILLVCDVEYFAPGTKIGVQEIRDDSTLETVPNSPEEWQAYPPPLRTLYIEQILPDVQIIVDSCKDVKAHRSILALHSTVFRRMFEMEHSTEAKTGRVNIEGTSYLSVLALIEYMYDPDVLHRLGVLSDRAFERKAPPKFRVDCKRRHPTVLSKSDILMCEAMFDEENEYRRYRGVFLEIRAKHLLEAMDDSIEELLALADRYDVTPLKKHCEKLMSKRLTVGNVCDALMLAETYSCDELKRACVDLLRDEHQHVFKTEQWKKLKVENTRLSSELLESIVSGADPSPVNDPTSVRVTGSYLQATKQSSLSLLLSQSQPALDLSSSASSYPYINFQNKVKRSMSVMTHKLPSKAVIQQHIRDDVAFTERFNGDSTESPITSRDYNDVKDDEPSSGEELERYLPSTSSNEILADLPASGNQASSKELRVSPAQSDTSSNKNVKPKRGRSKRN